MVVGESNGQRTLLALARGMNGPRENETGIGALRTSDGRPILDNASYNLTIDHARIAGGLPQIRGEILNPPDGGFSLNDVGREMLLRLQDGREWECRLADARGTLTPRGEEFSNRRSGDEEIL